MATQKIFEVLVGADSKVFIEYNDVNLRIGNIVFTVPNGISVLVRIWDEANLVLDTEYQPGNYSEVVPGNHRVIEYVDADSGETFAALPPNIAWSYSEIVP